MLVPDAILDPALLRDIGEIRMSDSRCWEPVEPVGLFCAAAASRWNDDGLPVCRNHL